MDGLAVPRYRYDLLKKKKKKKREGQSFSPFHGELPPL